MTQKRCHYFFIVLSSTFPHLLKKKCFLPVKLAFTPEWVNLHMSLCLYLLSCDFLLITVCDACVETMSYEFIYLSDAYFNTLPCKFISVRGTYLYSLSSNFFYHITTRVSHVI